MESDSNEEWSKIWNDDEEILDTSLYKKPNTDRKDVASASGEGSASKSNVKSLKVVTSLELNDNKAGMDGLDRERINKIIMDTSKGSRFYENEQKKQRQTLCRIEEQKARTMAICRKQLDEGVKQADMLLSRLDQGRDLSRTIVHVDMDAFFAAVEMRDDPSLRDKPMAVGCSSMLSTSNYAARRFGVRAAMPGFIGRKLCPQLVIVPPDFQKYSLASHVVRTVFAAYDRGYCPMSLDEAYLDITEHLRTRNALTVSERTFPVPPHDQRFCQCRSEKSVESTNDDDRETDGVACAVCGKPLYDSRCPPMCTFGLDAWSAVEEMRFRIYSQTQLTASAGIAPNMMLAKVCSDRNKPNGQFMVPACRQTIMEFIDELPIRKVSGIGKVTESLLAALDVSKCSGLYHQRGLLYHLFSPISFNYFMRIAIGVGATKVESDGERKSISVERTFGTLSCPTAMLEKCHELCAALVEDLRTEQIRGKTITIKLKTINFEVKTRAQTLSDYTMELDSIYGAATNLLRTEMKLDPDLQLRLMGIRLSNFYTPAVSPTKQSGQAVITDFFSKRTLPPTTAQAADTARGYPTPPGDGDEISAHQSTEDGMAFSVIDSSDDTDSDIYDMDTDIEEQSSEDIVPEEQVSVRMETETEVVIERPDSRNDVIDENRVPEESDRNNQCDFVCPICSELSDCPDLRSFNLHIDSCLSEPSSESKPGSSSNSSNVTLKSKVKERQVTLADSFSFSCSRYHLDKVDDVSSDCDEKILPLLNNTNHECSVTLRKEEAAVADDCEKRGEAVSSDGCSFFCGKKELYSTLRQSKAEEIDERLKCPICGRVQVIDDLTLFNRHIDACLSRGKAVKRKRSSAKSQVKKKSRR